MDGKILNRKGQSIIMWASVFVVVLAVLATVQRPLSNSLQQKVNQTSDLVLWSSWGIGEPWRVDTGEELLEELADGDEFDNTRTRTRTAQKRKQVAHEAHGGLKSSFLDPNDNEVLMNRVTASTGDGYEMLIQQDQFLDQGEFDIAAPEF